MQIRKTVSGWTMNWNRQNQGHTINWSTLAVTSKSTRFSKSAIPWTERTFSDGDESKVRTRSLSTEAANACGIILLTPVTFWNKITTNDLSPRRLASKSSNWLCLTVKCQSWLTGYGGSKIFINCWTLCRLAQTMETTLFSVWHWHGAIRRGSGHVAIIPVTNVEMIIIDWKMFQRRTIASTRSVFIIVRDATETFSWVLFVLCWCYSNQVSPSSFLLLPFLLRLWLAI